MDSAPKSIAGHPPAVKVGGMRVARRRTSSGTGGESSKQTKPKEANEHTTNGTVENGDTLKSSTDDTTTPASETVDAAPEKEKEKTAEQIEKEERSLRKRQQHEVNLLIAGAMTRGDEDFPTAAVRAFHEKPEPTRNRPRQSEPQPTFHHQNRVIQQPK